MTGEEIMPIKKTKKEKIADVSKASFADWCHNVIDIVFDKDKHKEVQMVRCPLCESFVDDLSTHNCRDEPKKGKEGV